MSQDRQKEVEAIKRMEAASIRTDNTQTLYNALERIKGLEKQLAEAREEIKIAREVAYDAGYHEGQKDAFKEAEEEREKIRGELLNQSKFNQVVVDANEQYIAKMKEFEKEVVKLKILVQQERYENQENKLNSIRFSRSHERVVEEEIKLNEIAKAIKKLKEEGDE